MTVKNKIVIRTAWGLFANFVLASQSNTSLSLSTVSLGLLSISLLNLNQQLETVFIEDTAEQTANI